MKTYLTFHDVQVNARLADYQVRDKGFQTALMCYQYGIPWEEAKDREFTEEEIAKGYDYFMVCDLYPSDRADLRSFACEKRAEARRQICEKEGCSPLDALEKQQNLVTLSVALESLEKEADNERSL